MNDEPRAGAIRYWSEDNKECVWANPGSLYYSTVTMAATEWFNGTAWVPIYEPEPEEP